MSEVGYIYKVVLFGATGSGKSSIINLLSDRQAADVSTDAESCTKQAGSYPISLHGRKFRLWDTMGFGQPEAKDIDPLSPYEQAHTLLQNLPGVDLILLCARIDEINASLRTVYSLLVHLFFSGQDLKIVLVLTHFDYISEEDRPGWWDKNNGAIKEKCNIPVDNLSPTCITTVLSRSPQSNLLHVESKQSLECLLLENCSVPPTPFPLKLSSSSGDTEYLKINYRLSSNQATRLARKFALPGHLHNVVFFGEAGVGKSSVINLLLGYQKANVSSGLDGCTLNFSSYEANVGSYKVYLWDTVGLNGTNMGKSSFYDAIENAIKLIHKLHDEGGVGLLVFCSQRGRLSDSALNNFRLFYEFLCDGHIPIAFVITYLENESCMEDWWKKEGEKLVRHCGLKPDSVAGHACITALDTQEHREKRKESRQSVEMMLEDSITYGRAFRKDKETWVTAFLKKFAGMVRVKGMRNSKKETIRKLEDRCGLSNDTAKELAELLCK